MTKIDFSWDDPRELLEIIAKYDRMPWVEGQMTIPVERVEDDYPLPKLPPKFICTSVRLAGQVLTRKEYTMFLIRAQPFFRGLRK